MWAVPCPPAPHSGSWGVALFSPAGDAPTPTSAPTATEEPAPAQVTDDPGFWNSFRENTLEDPETAVGFFDLVCGEAPNWTAPGVLWLRKAFADGDTVHLAVPMIEGLVQGNEWEWTIPVEKLVVVQFGLAESA